jgi:hypothetical protein
MLSRFLSPWYAVSSGCGWRRQPSDMVGSLYTLDNQSQTTKGWSSSLVVGHGVNSSSAQKKNTLLRNGTQGLGHERILWNTVSNGKWT